MYNVCTITIFGKKTFHFWVNYPFKKLEFTLASLENSHKSLTSRGQENSHKSLTSRGQIHVLADGMKEQTLITGETQTHLNQNIH